MCWWALKLTRTSCTSAAVACLLVGCVVDAPADGEIEPTVLAAEDSLDMAYGWARFGSSLAFTPAGELAVGQPSEPLMIDADNVVDDRVWIFHDRDFVLNVTAGLDDPWDEAEPTLGTDENGFGHEIVSTGDVTGDGTPDLAIAESPLPERGDGEWAVFAGPDFATSSFLDGWPTKADGSTCGDLTGDGIAELCTTDGVVSGPLNATSLPTMTWTNDVVTIGESGGGTLLLATRNASEVFEVSAWDDTIPVDLGEVARAVWTATSGHAAALGNGDLNDDGQTDVVAAWADDDVIYVGLPAGGGDVAHARTFIEWGAKTLAIADFDGDCVDDLAAGGGAEVAVWLGPLPEGVVTVTSAAALYRGLQYPDDAFGQSLAASTGADCEGADLAVGAPLEAVEGTNSYYESGRAWWLSRAGL